MGRTQPSAGRPPASFRKDARSKKAKATKNKVIPSLLSAHPRANRGIEAAELIVDPPPQKAPASSSGSDGSDGKGQAVSPRGPPRLTLRVADTLTAAHSLLQPQQQQPSPSTPRGPPPAPVKIGILNMASALEPGGGFENGATSQEGSLCMRTTLLPSLRREWYRLPEVGAVYTPDVLVFRDEEAGDLLRKRDRWFVDCVVSAAMLRLPETEVDGETGRGRYASEGDREMVVRKMRAAMRVFAEKGATRVVLGAWGCGAYGNPVGEVAAAWRRVLLGGREGAGNDGGNKRKGRRRETWSSIEEVVFAIKEERLADGFMKAFGDGLERQEAEDDEGGDCELDLEAQKMEELTDKIRELEISAEQTRSPHLRSALESMLVGLKSQLPKGPNEKPEEELEDEEAGDEEDENEAAGEDDDTDDSQA